MKIHPGVRPGRVPENKKSQTGQDNQKKARRYISHMWAEATANGNATKFGKWVDVLSVITHAKF